MIDLSYVTQLLMLCKNSLQIRNTDKIREDIEKSILEVCYKLMNLLRTRKKNTVFGGFDVK